MKNRNGFLSRLFAGFMVVVLATAGLPGNTYAADAVSEYDYTQEETTDADLAVSERFSEDGTFSFAEWTESLQEALPTVNSETSKYAPYAKIRYSYSADVTPGTIRWITQNKKSVDWYDYRYWNSWDYMAYQECGTTCQSMALSYIGINETPYSLLTKEKGLTRFTKSYAEGMTVRYGTNSTDQSKFTTELHTVINKYLKYSDYAPVIIHVNNYPAAGGGVTSHYIIIVGKKSTGVYQTLDPWDNGVTEIKLSGRTVTYTLGNVTKTENIDEFYSYRNTKLPEVVNPDVPSADPDPDPVEEPTGEMVTPCSSISGTVIGNNVNVRKEAGTYFEILDTLNYYDAVTITGKTTNWYRVKYTKNGTSKTGYIYKQYVAECARPAKITFTLKPYYNNKMLISWGKKSGVTGYVVKRYNASTKKYEVIARIASATTTSYVDKNLVTGKTYKYKVYAYKTTKGTNMYSPAPDPVSATAKKYMTGRIIDNSVNVRKGPGTSYEVLRKVNKGANVRVYGKTGDWYKIRITVNGAYKYGYVKKNYIKI